MLVGYLRVSSDSDRQSTDLQRDALLAAGVDVVVDARHLFEDHASGAKDDRTGLAQALEFVRPGDVLVVWKLDRLGRSLSHLLAIVTSLKDKQIAFRSLTEGMDTTTASGELSDVRFSTGQHDSFDLLAGFDGRAEELGGLVWAYIGPDPVPQLLHGGILASMPLTAHLAFAAFIDGKLIGEDQSPPPIRFPGAIALPMFIIKW